MVEELEMEKLAVKDINNNNSADEINIDTQDNDVFSDIRYICNSTSLIVESLQKGLDVAQLPTGDIIITEIKTVNTHYSWNKEKQRMMKVGQSETFGS